MDVTLIEKVRQRSDKSQEQFAKAIGMTKNGYQSLIKNGDLKVSTLETICQIFGVDISYFFGPKNISVVSEPQAEYSKRDNCQDLRNTIDILREQNKNNQATISALTTTIEALNEQLAHPRPAKPGKF